MDVLTDFSRKEQYWLSTFVWQATSRHWSPILWGCPPKFNREVTHPPSSASAQSWDSAHKLKYSLMSVMPVKCFVLCTASDDILPFLNYYSICWLFAQTRSQLLDWKIP